MEKFRRSISVIFLVIIGLLISIVSLKTGILLSAISIIAIIIFVKRVKIKNFSLFLILFSLFTKIISVVVLKTSMLADYEVMYNASISAINGDFSFISSSYFTTYGYQLGHVFYQALMLKIFNSVLFLKIMNCIFATGSTFLIYLILKKFVKEDNAKIISLIYSISLYPLYLNGILGNQQLSLVLFLLGIYILLTKKNTVLNGIIIGILFALGNIERPEGIVYIVTLIVYNIITINGFKTFLKSTVPILIVYFSITNLVSFAMIKSGVNEIGLGNSDPYWKFLVGFSYDYNGKNNLDDYTYTYDVESEKEEVIKRITNFKKMPKLFYNKIKIQWLYDDLDDTFNVLNNKQFSNTVLKLIINYVKVMNYIVIILAGIGVFKNKHIDKKIYFFIINILVYFGVYLLIEVSARYYYAPMVGLFILAAFGLEALEKTTLVKKLFKKC